MKINVSFGRRWNNMSMDNGYLMIVLSGFLGRLPVIAALVVGLVISLYHYGKQARVATAGAIGFSGLLLINLFSPFLNLLYLNPHWMGQSRQVMGIIQGIIQIFFTLLDAAFIGVLIYALFFAEKKEQNQPAA